MERPVRVALVRSDNRRGAVAGALDLIADDLRSVVAPRTLLKPNLVSHVRQLPSTHADAFSATLDALFAAGAREVTVAEGASDATAGFARFGLVREAHGRPVRFLDLNREERDWLPLTLSGVDGASLDARVSATVAGAGCRVSLALLKTHVTTTATFGLKNMLSSVHPEDRIRMHGYRGGNGSAGWKRRVVEWLKRDDWLVNLTTRALGRARRLKNALQGKDGDDGWRRLSAADVHFLRSSAALNRNLSTLAGRVGPHVSVLDGFVAMHREGPRHGTPLPLGVAIAGTDPVAVDSVAAAVLGFDPRRIGYLAHAEAAGLGCADLDAISVVGDPIASVRRRAVPNSNHAVYRHWGRLAELDGRGLAGPHRPGRSASTNKMREGQSSAQRDSPPGG